MDISSILRLTFVVIVVIQTLYYFVLLFGFLKSEKTKHKVSLKTASVIVYSKTDLYSLKMVIDALLRQDFEHFEIVLITHEASDEVETYAEELQLSNNRISHVNVPLNERFWNNKSYALTLGVKASQNEVIVFTDTDFVPESNRWLSSVMCSFSEGKDVFVGYSRYGNSFKNPLGIIQQYKNYFFSKLALGFGKLGMVYKGQFSNLAMLKSVFYENSGFNTRINSVLGADALLVNDLQSNYTTTVSYNADVVVNKTNLQSFKSFIYSLKKEVFIVSKFKWKHKLILSMFWLFELLFFVSLPIALYVINNSLIFMLIAVRYFVKYISMAVSANALKELRLLLFSLLIEPILLILVVFSFLNNLILKPKYWK